MMKKLSKQNIFLTIFAIASVVYGYAYVNNLLEITYFSKPLITTSLLVYYLVLVPKMNRLFLASLLFASISHILLLNTSETTFLIGMALSLIFILINMTLIAEKIGEIRLAKFFKITIPIIFILVIILFLIFKKGSEITWLFYIFGSVIAIYTSFSVYLYSEKRDVASLLNLIGIILFIIAAIAKGLEHIDASKVSNKIVNVIFYPSSLFFICLAFIKFGENNSKKSIER